MADVLVKGMKMPKSCGRCDLCVLSNDKLTLFCIRLGKRFRWSLVEKRQEDCPLVALPEHGRLIDADDLKKRMTDLLRHDYVFDEVGCFGLVKDAPTVLEASE